MHYRLAVFAFLLYYSYLGEEVYICVLWRYKNDEFIF